MKHVAWTKRKSALTLTLCAIIATSTIIILQNTKTTQAALIDPHPGLVGWWRFDEGTGTIADDNSGNGNNGTITGATWTVGKYGSALSFSGADFVALPDADSLQMGTKDFSLFAWIYPTAYPADGAYKSFIGGETGAAMLGLRNSNGNLRFVKVNTLEAPTSGQIIPLNAWSLVGVTFNSTLTANNLRYYYNGALVATVTFNQDFTAGASTNLIGCADTAHNYGFSGVIDEVRVYNQVLSTSDVQMNFQNSPDFSTKLVAKVPKGTTQVFTTLTWQGTGSINVTLVAPSQNYTEDTISTYQKTVYSTSIRDILNIKRLSVTVTALPADQNWYVVLSADKSDSYQIAVEAQK